MALLHQPGSREDGKQTGGMLRRPRGRTDPRGTSEAVVTCGPGPGWGPSVSVQCPDGAFVLAWMGPSSWLRVGHTAHQPAGRARAGRPAVPQDDRPAHHRCAVHLDLGHGDPGVASWRPMARPGVGGLPRTARQAGSRCAVDRRHRADPEPAHLRRVDKPRALWLRPPRRTSRLRWSRSAWSERTSSCRRRSW